MDIVALVKQYGFPVVAAVGLGYFVVYVWKWATSQVKPVLGEANTTLIALIDRIRMLDNDLIRLNQKLNVVLQMREQEQMKKKEDAMIDLAVKQNKEIKELKEENVKDK
jgi:hypothetical protein